MQAAGMNDWSGQWAYRVGLPAKSGISGGLMIVVPNVMGIAIYSPLIDNSFNSGKIFRSRQFYQQLTVWNPVKVRGVEFGLKLVEKFHFHEFDPIRLRTTVQLQVRFQLGSTVAMSEIKKRIY